MMACRDFEQLVALYVEEDLDAVDRHRIERHLRGCGACAALAEDLRESQALFKSLRQNLPDEAMLVSVRNEVLVEIQAASRGWADVLFGVYRQRATLAGVILLLVGSVVWFHEGEPVSPIPVAPSPVAPPVAVPNDVPREPTPKVAAVRAKVRTTRPTPPDPADPPQQITIKLLTDDPNVIIYWLVDENGD
jgi:hypothetical protein